MNKETETIKDFIDPGLEGRPPDGPLAGRPVDNDRMPPAGGQEGVHTLLPQAPAQELGTAFQDSVQPADHSHPGDGDRAA